MILPLFRRRSRPDTISRLYGMIVAQARLPIFYRDYAVPDTVNSRFDMVVLHLSLFLHRLRSEPRLKALGQAVFDVFCADMDGNLREIGIGDLSVPKEMRRIGAAFYGRIQAYWGALASEKASDLTDALLRNVYSAVPAEAASVGRLAAYIQVAVGHLAKQEASEFASGEITFPDPAAIEL
jgi:cytochrome b pre-mRNA-processing protein 3